MVSTRLLVFNLMIILIVIGQSVADDAAVFYNHLDNVIKKGFWTVFCQVISLHCIAALAGLIEPGPGIKEVSYTFRVYIMCATLITEIAYIILFPKFEYWLAVKLISDTFYRAESVFGNLNYFAKCYEMYLFKYGDENTTNWMREIESKTYWRSSLLVLGLLISYMELIVQAIAGLSWMIFIIIHVYIYIHSVDVISLLGVMFQKHQCTVLPVYNLDIWDMRTSAHILMDKYVKTFCSFVLEAKRNLRGVVMLVMYMRNQMPIPEDQWDIRDNRVVHV